MRDIFCQSLPARPDVKRLPSISQLCAQGILWNTTSMSQNQRDPLLLVSLRTRQL